MSTIHYEPARYKFWLKLLLCEEGEDMPFLDKKSKETWNMEHGTWNMESYL